MQTTTVGEQTECVMVPGGVVPFSIVGSCYFNVVEIIVRDVFQFAAPVNWFARESPITRGKARRTFREADNRRGNLLTIQLVAEQEIDGGPGLCQISL